MRNRRKNESGPIDPRSGPPDLVYAIIAMIALIVIAILSGAG